MADSVDLLARVRADLIRIITLASGDEDPAAASLSIERIARVLMLEVASLASCTATTAFDGAVVRCQLETAHDGQHFSEIDPENALAWGANDTGGSR